MNFSADMGCLGPDLNRHRLEVIVFAAFRGGYAPILGGDIDLISCAKSRLSKSEWISVQEPNSRLPREF